MQSLCRSLRLALVACKAFRRVQATALSLAGGLALMMLQLFVPEWSTALAAALPAAMRNAVPIGLDVLAVAVLTAGPLVTYLATRKG